MYAADDLAAERPLFTVELTSFDEDDEEDEGDGGEGEAVDDDELRRVLLGLDDDTLGPVREAVLYGAPFDGAEVLVVSADEDPEQPPLTEWSAGPVRPLLPDAGRRRVAKHREQAADSLRLELQGRELAEQQAAVSQVRRWRAGWLDWLATAFLVQWGLWLVWGWFDEPGFSSWTVAFIPLLGLYFMLIKVPEQVAKAKQMAGSRNPQPASIVMYIFLSYYALAKDLNEVWDPQSSG